jgi:hypothetical protein
MIGDNASILVTMRTERQHGWREGHEAAEVFSIVVVSEGGPRRTHWHSQPLSGKFPNAADTSIQGSYFGCSQSGAQHMQTSLVLICNHCGATLGPHERTMQISSNTRTMGRNKSCRPSTQKSAYRQLFDLIKTVLSVFRVHRKKERANHRLNSPDQPGLRSYWWHYYTRGAQTCFEL